MHMLSVSLFHKQFPPRDFYPFNLEVLQQTARLVFSSRVTFFVGENGTGKSTLLEALARECGVHIWEAGLQRRGRLRNPYEQDLYKYIRVEWSNGRVSGSFFASDIFRDFRQILDDWAAGDPGMLDYFGGESLMNKSHGQSLMAFFKARYKIKGLYFLDEPETALSPRSQLELVSLLKKMSSAGHAQFIIATHSPILLSCPGATIYSFDFVPVSSIAYEDTDHYRIYKSFFEDTALYLK